MQAIGIGLIWYLSMLFAMVPARHYGKSGAELEIKLSLAPAVLLPFLWLPVLLFPAFASRMPGLETAARGAGQRLLAWLPASPAAAWAVAGVVVTGLYLLAARRFERLDSFRIGVGPLSAIHSALRPESR